MTLTTSLKLAGYQVAIALAACACGSSPTDPSGAALSRTIETSSYVFRFSEGDSVNTEWQETYHAWAIRELDVHPSQRITYNKYLSREHMGEIYGVSNTNGIADPVAFAIHTLWPIDNHEVIHLYSSAFGRAVALFSEGLAVAHQTNPAAGDFTPKWSGTPVHTLARQFRDTGRLVAIGDLITSNGFRRFDSNVTYPEAGSFVRYLIDRFGLPSMKQLFAAGTPNDSAIQVRDAFQSIFGLSIDDAERDWLAMLDAR